MSLEAALAPLTNRIKAGRSVREDVVVDNRLLPGEVGAQGDVLITYLGDTKPDLSNLVPITEDQRLVPGTDDGGRHRLVAKPGVFATPTPTNLETYTGPVIFVAAGTTTTIVHDGSSQHGPVTLVGPCTISISYPREFDREQAAERRARD